MEVGGKVASSFATAFLLGTYVPIGPLLMRTVCGVQLSAGTAAIKEAGTIS